MAITMETTDPRVFAVVEDGCYVNRATGELVRALPLDDIVVLVADEYGDCYDMDAGQFYASYRSTNVCPHATRLG